MIAFSYYGAKNGLLSQLLPLLPESDHYCEVFGGSAAVLLNRKASPIETFNDLNKDIVNFFEVLRNNPEELVYQLEYTPYSFDEFQNSWSETSSAVEKARRFYIRTQMDIAKAGRSGDKSWSVNVKYVQGSHSYSVKNFHSKIPGLVEVAKRFKMVQIENKPALDVINKYDHPGTLFYCDPPYVPESRNANHIYKFEMKLSDHVDLAERLNSVKGRVALSGYESPKMEELYPESKWNKIRFNSARVPMSKKGLVRQECLWVNYNPPRQLELFTH